MNRRQFMNQLALIASGVILTPKRYWQLDNTMMMDGILVLPDKITFDELMDRIGYLYKETEKPRYIEMRNVFEGLSGRHNRPGEISVSVHYEVCRDA